jgi:hypothetical protein
VRCKVLWQAQLPYGRWLVHTQRAIQGRRGENTSVECPPERRVLPDIPVDMQCSADYALADYVNAYSSVSDGHPPRYKIAALLRMQRAAMQLMYDRAPITCSTAGG